MAAHLISMLGEEKGRKVKEEESIEKQAKKSNKMRRKDSVIEEKKVEGK